MAPASVCGSGAGFRVSAKCRGWVIKAVSSATRALPLPQLQTILLHEVTVRADKRGRARRASTIALPTRKRCARRWRLRPALRTSCAGKREPINKTKGCATKRRPSGLSRQTGIKHGWRSTMSPTIAECLEHARQCEWYAARTNDEEDRKFLLRVRSGRGFRFRLGCVGAWGQQL